MDKKSAYDCLDWTCSDGADIGQMFHSFCLTRPAILVKLLASYDCSSGWLLPVVVTLEKVQS
jgi:hypothetical protein